MTKIISHRCNWSSKHYACNISGGSRNVPKQFKSLPLVSSKSLNTCLLNCMLFPQLNHSLLIYVTYQGVKRMSPIRVFHLSLASLSNTCLLNCMLFLQLNDSLLIHVTYQEVQGMPPNKSLPLVSIASLSNTCLLNCMFFPQLNHSLPSETLI